MKAEDRIYQLFAEANPAPVSAVSTIARPEAAAVLSEAGRPIMLTKEPKILDPQSVRTRAQRWRGPALAFASFAAVALVIGGSVWLARTGDEGSVVDQTTLPPVTTTQAPPETTVPPATTTPPPPVVFAVPDLQGLTVSEAQGLAETAGFELVVLGVDIGSAVISAQDPAPGVEVTAGAVVTVDAAVTPTCNPPDPIAPGIGQIIITAFFECDNGTTFPTAGIGVPRIVPEQGGEAIDRIEWTLRSLLAGPTEDERIAGFVSFFDAATADALNGVTLTDGVLVVDFNEDIYVDNANTSTGSLFFNASLRSNVFLHPEVDSVEFRVNGDCEAWSAFFESDGCWVITRADWEGQLAEWDELRNQ
jgi:hypothetical protein